MTLNIGAAQAKRAEALADGKITNEEFGAIIEALAGKEIDQAEAQEIILLDKGKSKEAVPDVVQKLFSGRKSMLAQHFANNFLIGHALGIKVTPPQKEKISAYCEAAKIQPKNKAAYYVFPDLDSQQLDKLLPLD